MKKIKKPVEIDIIKTPTFGVQATLDVLKFGFEVQHAIVNTIEDKKVTVWDLPFWLNPLRAAGKAFQNFREVKNELLDLDDNDKKILSDFVRQYFDIADDEIEQLIEDTITAVLSDIAIASKWADHHKQTKTAA